MIKQLVLPFMEPVPHEFRQGVDGGLEILKYHLRLQFCKQWLIDHDWGTDKLQRSWSDWNIVREHFKHISETRGSLTRFYDYEIGIRLGTSRETLEQELQLIPQLITQIGQEYDMPVTPPYTHGFFIVGDDDKFSVPWLDPRASWYLEPLEDQRWRVVEWHLATAPGQGRAKSLTLSDGPLWQCYQFLITQFAN